MNRHRMTVAALAAALFLAAPLAAQTQDPRESPYRLSWARDGAIFAAAGTGVGIADLVTSEHDPLTETELGRFDRNDVLWFDRPATHRFDTDLIRLSEQIGTPLALAPLALLLDSSIRGDWKVLGVMYVQTTMLSAATSTIAKESIRRYRPYVYNTDLTYEQRTEREPGKAFFSSAATSAFAHAVLLATVFGDHHPDSALKPVVWGGAIAAAGTVSYLRFASGIHYPSDVLVGAAVGAGIGHLVPRLHRTNDRAFTVVPSAGPEGAGLVIRIDF